MPEKISVVVVDDHLSIRQMLERIFAFDEQYELVGHSGSGLAGLQLCRELKPRVAIVDLLLPEMSGVEVLRALRAEGRDTRVLIYSGTLNASLIASVIDARPHGFVHKEDSLATLLEALRTVAQGGSYLTPFTMSLAEGAQAGLSMLAQISSRERTVLKLVAEGCSSKQIADRLGIATKTVEHHRMALMQKLDVHDIAGLTRLAVREGLVNND
ncbi:MAG: response regulator transcription factor [Chthoniobacteraceae bacterium]